MNTRPCLLHLLVALIGIGIAASSAHAVAVPAEFSFSFDGSSLPSAQGFTLADTLNSESSDGDIYSIDIGGDGNAGVYTETDDNWTWVNAPNTLEYRLKVIDTQNFRIRFAVAGRGSYQMALFADFFAPNDDWLFSGTGGGELSLSPDLFHTIRLVDNPLTPGIHSTAYDVYVDGTLLLPQWEGFGTALDESPSFGDLGGGGSGTVEIDYIAWTFDGAFPPVPEPATLTLLALGGLVMMKRRQR